jgi:predicted DNA binding protein
MATPLRYRDAVYGVLIAYTDRTGAFGEREQGAFGEFGELIGAAINATVTRRLLYTNAVLELEFRTRESGAVFTGPSREADCRVVLDRTVSISEDAILFYVTVEGAPAERIAELVADDPLVLDTRIIRERPDGGTLEVAIRNATITSVLAAHGAKTIRAVADQGEIRLLAEAPLDIDVRELVNALGDEYPGIELTAKREVERRARTSREFREGVIENLTERQRAALEATYFAGYYDWPKRGSTAEEIARSMGVAPQTLHQHLRVAQRKLLGSFLTPEREPPITRDE